MQVHLLARLATVLDLLHEHGKRIHGNLTPRHVLVDTHQSPHSFTIVDFSCARGIGGVLLRFQSMHVTSGFDVVLHLKMLKPGQLSN